MKVLAPIEQSSSRQNIWTTSETVLSAHALQEAYKLDTYLSPLVDHLIPFKY
jgi:hypothetical protein